MSLVWTAVIGVVLVVRGTSTEQSDTACEVADEAQATSPALVQMRTGRGKMHESTEMGKSADAIIHGVRVTNYHQEADLTKDQDDDPVWEVVFKLTTDEELDQFCARILRKGAKCKSHGHPDEHGLPTAAIQASKESINSILESEKDNIEAVDRDQILKIALWEVHEDEIDRGSTPWGIDRVDQTSLPLSDSFTSPGKQGEGIHVYVLDTGVRTSHNDFEGRAEATIDTIRGNGDVVECNGEHGAAGCALDRHMHGTHCAGTVAGKTYGVAKKATIHAVKVLSDQGSGSLVGILAAMDWIAMKKVGNRAVASMSLGGSGQATSYTTAINKLLDNGVVTVVASGNSNSDACNFQPAFSPPAITVGATTSLDWRSDFSNYGSCV